MPPDARRVIEPFVGSGAVALNIGLDAALLGDTNADLIRLFQFLSDVADYCSRLLAEEFAQRLPKT